MTEPSQTISSNEAVSNQQPSFHQEVQELKKQNGVLKTLVYILGVIVLLTLGALGMWVYQQGTEVKTKTIIEKSENSNLENTTMSAGNSTTQPTEKPQTAKTLTWKTQPLSIQYESAMAGKMTLTMEVKVPEGWTLQTYPKQANAEDMIKNCADYTITSPNKGLSMQLSPFCSGWAAKYSNWPADAAIVFQSKRSGATGEHDFYRLRLNEATSSTYAYVDADSKTQIMDAILITYDTPNEMFVPAHLTATYSAGDKTDYLSIADQIAASIILR